MLAMTAAWLALAMFLNSPSGWMAVVVALDMVLMLRLGAAPPGPSRAWLAVGATATVTMASYWLVAAAQMGRMLGLSPLDSAQRLGPVLAGELTRHATTGWDAAWTILALLLAWRLGR